MGVVIQASTLIEEVMREIHNRKRKRRWLYASNNLYDMTRDPLVGLVDTNTNYNMFVFSKPLLCQASFPA